MESSWGAGASPASPRTFNRDTGSSSSCCPHRGGRLSPPSSCLPDKIALRGALVRGAELAQVTRPQRRIPGYGVSSCCTRWRLARRWNHPCVLAVRGRGERPVRPKPPIADRLQERTRLRARRVERATRAGLDARSGWGALRPSFEPQPKWRLISRPASSDQSAPPDRRALHPAAELSVVMNIAHRSSAQLDDCGHRQFEVVNAEEHFEVRRRIAVVNPDIQARRTQGVLRLRPDRYRPRCSRI